MIKYFFYLIVAITLTSFITFKRSTKWVITKNSSLTIKGNTNVNTFTCSILKYLQTDTITIDQVNDKIVLNGVLSLKTKDFECNNMIMTHQFRKTLKHPQFQSLQVNFLSLKEFPNQNVRQVKGLVAIEIAGTMKQFEICYELERINNIIVLKGNQPINFSDFKLIAPQRIGSLIKTDNRLNVVFELKMKLIE